MSNLDQRKPDLVSYFSNSTKYTKYTQTLLEPNSILQTVISDIYADINLTKKIGSRSHTATIYDVKNVNNIKKNSFKLFNSSSTFLPQGTILSSPTWEVSKNKEGIYNPNSGTYTYKITSGTGNFLNSKGYLVCKVDKNTSISKVSVYFDKK